MKKRHKEEAGFTVMEVLVAMSIFTIAILGLAASATSIMRANQTSQFHTAAVHLAQDKLEELRSRTVANIAGCNLNCDNPVPTHQNVAYTRTWVVTPNFPVAGVSQVAVTVQWIDRAPNSLTVTSAVSQ